MDNLNFGTMIIMYFSIISFICFIVLCFVWFTQLLYSTPPLQSKWYAPGTILSYSTDSKSSRAIVINDNDVIIKMIDEKPWHQIDSLEHWLEGAGDSHIRVDFSIVKRLEELRRKADVEQYKVVVSPAIVSKHRYNLRPRNGS